MGDWIRSLLLGLLKKAFALLDPGYAKELEDFDRLKKEKVGEISALENEIAQLGAQAAALNAGKAAALETLARERAAIAQIETEIGEVQNAKAEIDPAAMGDGVDLLNKL